MYERVVTIVRTISRDTREFPATIGSHQRSTLSSHLFALIMEELTTHVQDEVLYYVSFADEYWWMN